MTRWSITHLKLPKTELAISLDLYCFVTLYLCIITAGFFFVESLIRTKHFLFSLRKEHWLLWVLAQLCFIMLYYLSCKTDCSHKNCQVVSGLWSPLVFLDIAVYRCWWARLPGSSNVICDVDKTTGSVQTVIKLHTAVIFYTFCFRLGSSYLFKYDYLNCLFVIRLQVF